MILYFFFIVNIPLGTILKNTGYKRDSPLYIFHNLSLAVIYLYLVDLGFAARKEGHSSRITETATDPGPELIPITGEISMR